MERLWISVSAGLLIVVMDGSKAAPGSAGRVAIVDGLDVRFEDVVGFLGNRVFRKGAWGCHFRSE